MAEVNGTQMALQEHRDRHAFSLIVREPVQEARSCQVKQNQKKTGESFAEKT